MAAIRENEVRLLKWAIAHLDDPNFVRNGKSPLDALAEEEELLRKLDSDPTLDSFPKERRFELAFAKKGPVGERLRLVGELRAAILRAGAKPGAELPAATWPVYLHPRSRRIRYGRNQPPRRSTVHLRPRIVVR